jgi:hypothetical protein
LVQADHGSVVLDVGEGPQDLVELESCVGIETSSCVVP